LAVRLYADDNSDEFPRSQHSAFRAIRKASQIALCRRSFLVRQPSFRRLGNPKINHLRQQHTVIDSRSVLSSGNCATPGQGPFPNRAAQLPEKSFELRRAQSVAAQEQRRRLPEEIVDN
jgi:hypothetical protein